MLRCGSRRCLYLALAAPGAHGFLTKGSFETDFFKATILLPWSQAQGVNDGAFSCQLIRISFLGWSGPIFHPCVLGPALY